MSIKKLTRTTAADVADLVEYAINETEPTVKTRRGVGTLIEVKVGRRKFLVSVCRPYRRRKSDADGSPVRENFLTKSAGRMK